MDRWPEWKWRGYITDLHVSCGRLCTPGRWAERPVLQVPDGWTPVTLCGHAWKQGSSQTCSASSHTMGWKQAFTYYSHFSKYYSYFKTVNTLLECLKSNHSIFVCFLCSFTYYSHFSRYYSYFKAVNTLLECLKSNHSIFVCFLCSLEVLQLWRDSVRGAIFWVYLWLWGLLLKCSQLRALGSPTICNCKLTDAFHGVKGFACGRVFHYPASWAAICHLRRRVWKWFCYNKPAYCTTTPPLNYSKAWSSTTVLVLHLVNVVFLYCCIVGIRVPPLHFIHLQNGRQQHNSIAATCLHSVWRAQQLINGSNLTEGSNLRRFIQVAKSQRLWSQSVTCATATT